MNAAAATAAGRPRPQQMAEILVIEPGRRLSRLDLREINRVAAMAAQIESDRVFRRVREALRRKAESTGLSVADLTAVTHICPEEKP
ncbi:MAG: hypothetical protein H6934_06360 [Burkholderiaceae bacterium]|nr:hypothetical protein [Burkholderiaceae bacterium]